MLALRYVYVLALVVWLGGMVVLAAIVAPSLFQVLQTREPESGRVLAGAVFGTVLMRFHYVAYLAGALLLVSLVVMAVLGPRPVGFAARSAIIFLMLATAVYSGVVVLGEIEQLRLSAGQLPSTLPADDARRIRFNELHQLSTRLMMFQVCGALALLYWEARE